ncbi:MAG: cytidine deaminase family protein [Candidatus Dormibacteraceae bacterium]
MEEKVTHQKLIDSAQAFLNPRFVGNHHFGNVASTLITEAGNRYSGVSISTGAGTGFCAEHSAIAAMVTAGEYKIAKIVAVWRDQAGNLLVLSPCGRCREFIWQIDEGNLNTEIILGLDTVMKLRDLLPFHEWPNLSTKQADKA